MVKGIPTNPDDKFSHQYAGGVNQYGTKGAENTEKFQGYMNDGMTSQTSDNKNPTPMNVMASKANPKFGPPPSTQPTSMQGAAPENFGPPVASASDTGGASTFGAPGFGDTPEVGIATNSNLGSEGPSTLGATDETPGSDDGGTDKPKKKKTYRQVEKMMTDQMLQTAISLMKIKDPDPSAWK